MQAIVDALHVVEGRPVTSSRIVSEYFEKKAQRRGARN